MDCYFPGRVIIGPNPESSEASQLAEILSGEFRGDFEYDFGVQDILLKNGLEIPTEWGSYLPFVGRISEGAEEEMSERLMGFRGVGSAIPDYLTYPAGISIDSKNIDQCLADIHGSPPSQGCGQGCVVGLLDTGVDPTVASSAQLHPVQYDALDPSHAGSSPNDSSGHGSTIAEIIGRCAPASKIVSVKTIDRNGTISSAVAGLYMAAASGPCHVLNLSFSVACTGTRCRYCKKPGHTAMNPAQLEYFFQIFLQQYPNTVLVSAAGNASSNVAYPAKCDNVIAVGSFDYAAQSNVYSYPDVPSGRFVLAPGGSKTVPFGQSATGFSSDFFHGTSFAAAFVTGFAARSVCGWLNPSCGSQFVSGPPGLGVGLSAAVLQAIAKRSDTSWHGYNSGDHGLGAIRF